MILQSLKYNLIVLACFLLIWTTAQSWLLVDEFSIEWSSAILDGVITSLFLSLAAFLVFNTLKYYHPDARQLLFPVLGVVALTYGLMIGAESTIESITSDSMSYLER